MAPSCVPDPSKGMTTGTHIFVERGQNGEWTENCVSLGPIGGTRNVSYREEKIRVSPTAVYKHLKNYHVAKALVCFCLVKHLPDTKASFIY